MDPYQKKMMEEFLKSRRKYYEYKITQKLDANDNFVVGVTKEENIDGTLVNVKWTHTVPTQNAVMIKVGTVKMQVANLEDAN